MAINAVIFDAYGTLFDVYSVTRIAESLYPNQGANLAALWRDKQIEYSRLRTLSGRYRPFSEVTADALRFALKKMNLPNDASVTRELLAGYERLDVFPENRDALLELKAKGVPLAILSNGDPPMLDAILRHARLASLFDHVLSADAVARFKTHPAVYELGVKALGFKESEILFVSSNCWDACGARWFGFLSFWINRQHQPLEELGVVPDATGTSMNDVVAFVSKHLTHSASTQP